MNAVSAQNVASLASALQATQVRLQRHARWQMALYVCFGLISSIALALVGHVLLTRGSQALLSAWPALLAQGLAIVALAAVLRSQWLRVRTLGVHGLTVAAAVQQQLADLGSRRRQTYRLLLVAALTPPMLCVAIYLLHAQAAMSTAQAFTLALLCLLPSAVIAVVHGSRLQRMSRERAELESLNAQLDGAGD